MELIKIGRKMTPHPSSPNKKWRLVCGEVKGGRGENIFFLFLIFFFLQKMYIIIPSHKMNLQSTYLFSLFNINFLRCRRIFRDEKNGVIQLTREVVLQFLSLVQVDQTERGNKWTLLSVIFLDLISLASFFIVLFNYLSCFYFTQGN